MNQIVILSNLTNDIRAITIMKDYSYPKKEKTMYEAWLVKNLEVDLL